MIYLSEAEFEKDFIEQLISKGWSPNIIKYPTEEDLIENWAQILFENNREIDRLNDYPLTKGEMNQLLEKINTLKSPVKLNEFINGKTTSIIRDNPDDIEHLGKSVALKLYDRNEICGGKSRYQIVEQPKLNSKSAMLNQRRGDLMLLINGIPVIHIELKKSDVPVSEAYYQIEKYSYEGAFTGLFSTIQVFVACEPKETVYFANPGNGVKFNRDYYFHWEDFDNKIINDWRDIVSDLLNIPMAHQLIGFYTIPDDTDGVLKVMRSYQCIAANKIADAVTMHDWLSKNQLGGYIWHTTGSGKTLTSFKSAQLIADSGDADKVIFLIDRIELGNQSLLTYRGFADIPEQVQETENTYILIDKLKSSNKNDKLIVTSIQKMSRIKDDGLKSADMGIINSKRIVFIVDECHRSVFGDMLISIKDNFKNALFFGFTGTPITEENCKNGLTTSMIFGDELHRYVITDGIRDHNVLGFDVRMMSTYKDTDLRKAVALNKAKATSFEDATSNEQKSELFFHYMNDVKMVGEWNDEGDYVSGIEDLIPRSQYDSYEHHEMVVNDIMENWPILSRNGEFHALLATSSIKEAIDYYNIFKNHNTDLNITALFNPDIENEEEFRVKLDGLIEIVNDYNKKFHQQFTLSKMDLFKKDVTNRLAHKEQYKIMEQGNQIDILIVVNQLLTGFDSKWINTLYIDKMLDRENIIQAFSRTNRIYGAHKPYGIIKYYRYPHTMKRNIDLAIEQYSGNRPYGLFVSKLDENIEKMNSIFGQIQLLFHNEGLNDFSQLPTNKETLKKFGKLFSEFNKCVDAARLQGFSWDKSEYNIIKKTDIDDNIVTEEFADEDDLEEHILCDLKFSGEDYEALLQRYKDLDKKKKANTEEFPFDIDPTIIEVDSGIIDVDYMNARFKKYIEVKNSNNQDLIEETLNSLHQSFAYLSQEDQKYANIFLHDVLSNQVELKEGKNFSDYVLEYKQKSQNDQIIKLGEKFGLDSNMLRIIMKSKIDLSNLNEFGRFDKLISTVDYNVAKRYLDSISGSDTPEPIVRIKVYNTLRDFLCNNGFDIEEYMKKEKK